MNLKDRFDSIAGLADSDEQDAVRETLILGAQLTLDALEVEAESYGELRREIDKVRGQLATKVDSAPRDPLTGVQVDR